MQLLQGSVMVGRCRRSHPGGVDRLLPCNYEQQLHFLWFIYGDSRGDCTFRKRPLP